MKKKFMEIIKQYHRVIKVSGAILGVCLAVGIAVLGIQGLGNGFDPSLLTGKDLADNGSQSSYDDTLFGGKDQSNKDSLSMDQKAEEDYNLNDGEQKLKDDQQSQSGMNIGNAGDGSDNNEIPVSGAVIGTDDSGNGIVIPGDGSDQGEPSGDGSGDDTDTGDSGNGGSGGSGGGSGSGTEEEPEEEKDPDDDKYGTDYKRPETIISEYPTESVDDRKNITAVSLEVTKGSLMQHFYVGEAPRSAEMNDYITVTAKMSDGSVRTNLQYKPSDSLGGDYEVQWADNLYGDTNDVGYPVVGYDYGTDAYQATLSYRGASCSLKYDIVLWQVDVTDFPEDFSQYEYMYWDEMSGDMYEVGELNQQMYPNGTPVIDLYNTMADMYNRIGIRTRLNEDEVNHTHYQYVNHTYSNPNDDSDYTQYCLEFFGGWSDEKKMSKRVSTGSMYKMARPTKEQIDEDGIYSVTLYPVWNDYSKDNEYIISLSGDVGYNWSTELLAYNGEGTTLTVPEGIATVNFSDMLWYANEEPNTRIKTLILPKSVTAFEFGGFDWISNYFPNLENIFIDKDNLEYLDIDGVVYGKTGTQLIMVPAGKKSIEKWSKNVTAIGPSAFYGVHMNQLTLPETLYSLGYCSLFDANIKKLVITSTRQVELGTYAFDSDQMDEDGNLILGISDITFCGSNIGWEETSFSAPELFYYLGEENLKELGLRIHVTSSGDDRTYLSALMALEQCIDAYSYDGNNSAFDLLSSEDEAQKRYITAEGSVLSKDGKTLICASPLLEGDVDLSLEFVSIAKNAFLYCTKVTSVQLPGTVQTIGDMAFDGASGLTTIVLPGNQAVTFGEDVFGDTMPEGICICIPKNKYQDYLTCNEAVLDGTYGDKTAQKLFLPVDVNRTLLVDQGNVYYDNGDNTYSLLQAKKSLTGSFQPMACTVSLEDQCFAGCSQLKIIVLGSEITSLGNHLFAGCGQLEVIASNGEEAPVLGATSLADLATGQVRLMVPDTEGVLEAYRSAGWQRFSSIDAYGSEYLSKTNNGNNALYTLSENKYHLVKAFITNEGIFALVRGTTEIEDYAFQNATLLTGISNATSVTRVGAYAFDGCTSLEGINLYRNMASLTLGEGAFRNCHRLSTVLGSYGTSAAMALPGALVNVPKDCFRGCSSISAVYADGANMTTVGEGAFADCTGMREVRLGVNVTSLGVSSFENCSSLQEVISQNPEDNIYYYSMPYGITEIPDACFKDCRTLHRAWMNDGVTRIGVYAFMNCSAMEFAVCPAQVTELGTGCFMNCSSMTEIASDSPYDETEDLFNALPYLVTTIPDSCCEGCSALEVLSIPNLVTSIGNRAFYGCTQLNRNGDEVDVYEIDDGVTYIGEEAFAACTSLVQVKSYGNLSHMGQNAFAEDGRLSEIHFANVPTEDGSWSELEGILEKYFHNCPLQSLWVDGENLLDNELE